METSASLPQIISRNSFGSSPRAKFVTTPNRPITGASVISSNGVFSQSATTLTRSVVHWSFAKAKRFHDYTNDTSEVPIPNLGTTLSSRATTQGFGTRKIFKLLDNPSPDAYDPRSGLFSSFSPVMHKRLNSQESGRESWDTHVDIPGPGSYEIDREIVKKNKGFLLKSRVEPIGK